jgi:hypothetical protein
MKQIPTTDLLIGLLDLDDRFARMDPPISDAIFEHLTGLESLMLDGTETAFSIFPFFVGPSSRQFVGVRGKEEEKQEYCERDGCKLERSHG